MWAVLLVVLFCTQSFGFVLPKASKSVVSKHWTLGAKVDENYPVTVTLALKQRNLDWLEETVLRVSSPRSASYGMSGERTTDSDHHFLLLSRLTLTGKYLSIDELAAKIAPSRMLSLYSLLRYW